MTTLWRAVRAEWTKLRTTPGPVWLLGAAAISTVALGAAVSATATCARSSCDIDVARLGFSGVYLGQAPIVVLAVLAVSGEHSTGLIGTTLIAVPRRATVLAAKALVLGVVVAVVGSLALLASLLVAARIRPDHGPLLRAASGSVAYLVLLAGLSLGIAAVIRDSAAATGAVLALLYLPPVVAQMAGNPHLQHRLEQVAPMTAGLSIQATTNLSRLPIGPWAGLAVLAAWSAGALLAGTLRLQFHDT
jgi:ABC-2 type transport system permease protein